MINKRVTPPSDSLDSSPVLEFVCLERYNAIRLVQMVHTSLADLNKVIRGNMLLTPHVQKLAGSLLKNEVSHSPVLYYSCSCCCHCCCHCCCRFCVGSRELVRVVGGS